MNYFVEGLQGSGKSTMTHKLLENRAIDSFDNKSKPLINSEVERKSRPLIFFA